MAKRRRIAIGRRSLTVAESSGIVVPHYSGSPITCKRCGNGGGTLVKVDDKYIHRGCER